MGLFDKLKNSLAGKPVSGVAMISDVQKVQNLLEEIVEEVLEEDEQSQR